MAWAYLHEHERLRQDIRVLLRELPPSHSENPPLRLEQALWCLELLLTGSCGRLGCMCPNEPTKTLLRISPPTQNRTPFLWLCFLPASSAQKCGIFFEKRAFFSSKAAGNPNPASSLASLCFACPLPTERLSSETPPHCRAVESPSFRHPPGKKRLKEEKGLSRIQAGPLPTVLRLGARSTPVSLCVVTSGEMGVLIFLWSIFLTDQAGLSIAPATQLRTLDPLPAIIQKRSLFSQSALAKEPSEFLTKLFHPASHIPSLTGQRLIV